MYMPRRRRRGRHPYGHRFHPEMAEMMSMEIEELLMLYSRRYAAPVREVRPTHQHGPPAVGSQSQPPATSQPGSEQQLMDSSSSGGDATGSQNVTTSSTSSASSVSQPVPSTSTSAEASVTVSQADTAINVTLAGQLAGTSVAPAVAGPSTGGVNLRSEQSGVPPPPAPVPSVVATDLVGSEGQSGGGSVVVSDLPGVQASSGSPPSGAKRTVSGSDEGSEGEQGGQPAAKEPRREGADNAEQAAVEEVQPEEEREDVERLMSVLNGALRRPVDPEIASRLRELPAEAVTVIMRELSYRFSDFGFPFDFSDEDSDEEEVDEYGYPVNPQKPAEPGKFPLSDEQMLLRLLILGGISTVRAGQFHKNQVTSDLSVINRMISGGQGTVVVHHMKDISVRGRSNKQELLMYCLAMCCRSSDQETKKAGYAAIKEMCRTPTQVFQLISFIEEAGESSGWGRGLRRAMCAWYNSYADNPLRLAMHMTKYWNRHEWCHRDVFRMAHIKPANDVIEFLVCYAVKGLKEAEKKFLEDGYQGNEKMEKVHKYLKAVEEAKQTLDVDRTVALIKEHDLVREQLRTEMLNKPEVWSIMLPHMPLTALIRNLGKMTKLELFSNPEHVKTVVSKLTNMYAMKKARVHPFRLLVAQHVYSKGSGELGSLYWIPNQEIVEALEKAFYQSFDAVEPSNKRILIALDISSSMTMQILGSPISCREAATCMCMVTVKREPKCDIVGFHTGLIPLAMFKDPNKKLPELIEETSRLGFGSTDCSKPMTWARRKKKEYDAFIIYTDSETNSHRIPPYATLQKYREAMNIPTAKLVVVGMNATGFTIARPDDMHMLDVTGFDPDTPEMIREFLVGGLD